MDQHTVPSNSSDVKITDVQTTLLTGPCTNDPFLLECRKRRSAAFIEVFTDSDLVGIGETYGGYYCPELVPATVDLYKPILIGRTVGNIEQIWQDMYHCENFWGRVGLGPIVLSGIDAALWDLKGKITGLPVYELLGGRKHDSLLGYATGGPSNYPKDRLAAKLDHYASLGFRAVKLGSGGLQDGRDIPLQGIAAAVDFEDVLVLKLGRHFRLPGGNKLIVGRNHDENEMLLGYWKLGRFHRLADHMGPLGLYIGDETADDFELALSITARYGDAPADQPARLELLEPHDQVLKEYRHAIPLPKGDERGWLIT